MNNERSGRPYRRARDELKARGQEQPCWRCGKTLFADLPRGHPLAITLGHFVPVVDGGTLADGYAAECAACNYGNGAAIANRRRRGESSGVSYRNPAY